MDGSRRAEPPLVSQNPPLSCPGDRELPSPRCRPPRLQGKQKMTEQTDKECKIQQGMTRG